MEHKPASAKRKSHQQAPAATTEDAQVAQVAEALSLAGQAPAAKVFVCGGHPSTPVPQRTQNFMSRVRQVVCSSYHAWFLLENGSCYAERPSGARRIVTVEDQRVRQVACAGSIAVLLMESGKVAWCKVGSDSSHPPLIELTLVGEKNPTFPPVKEVACTEGYVLLLCEERSVFMVKLLAGPTASMCLGNQTVRVSAPVLCFAPNVGVVQIAGSVANFAALTAGGDLYTWEPSSEPTKVEGLENKGIKSIAAGSYHMAAITNDGQLYTWGGNSMHQLGLGGGEKKTAIPKRVAALYGKPVVSVSCGSSHTACLTEMGRVYTWGAGTSGALGHGQTADQITPRLVEELRDMTVSHIACGWYHTIAVVSVGADPNKTKLAKDISSLLAFDGDNFSDATVYGRGSARGLACHKMVLGRLPAWKRIIEENDAKAGLEAEPVLHVDVEDRLLPFVVRAVYGHPLAPDLATATYLQLAAVAKRLKFAAFFEEVVATFGSGINADNVCRVWRELAHLQKRIPGIAGNDLGPNDDHGLAPLVQGDLARFHSPCFVMVIFNFEQKWSSDEEFRAVAYEASQHSHKIESMIKEKTRHQTSRSVREQRHQDQADKTVGTSDEGAPTTMPEEVAQADLAGASAATGATTETTALPDHEPETSNTTGSSMFEEYESTATAEEEESLSSTLAAFVDNERYADVKLVVEGRDIQAHKAILCARSSHFRAMFTLGMREATTNVIEVGDISYEVFATILRYLYAAEVELQEETVVELMISANQYVLLPLQEQCEAFIEQGLSAENAGYFLEMANRFQAQHLKALALEYMVQHRAEFESNEEALEDLSPELLHEYRQKISCAQECLVAGSGINWAPVNSFSTFSIQSCNVDGDLLASGGQEFEVKIYPIDVPELADTPGSDFDSARSASTDDKEAEGDDKRMANLDANRYDDRLLEDIKTQLQQQGFIKARVTEYLQVANPTGEYVVQYGVPYRGTYRLEVTLYGKHVRGSPFIIWAGHEYSPHDCELIYDAEQLTLVAGEYRTFTLVAKDSFGQQCLGGGKEWEATIGEALDGSGVSLEDHNDGTYTLSVMATLAGQHPLTVGLKSDALTLFGRHIGSTTARPSRPIKGSPFQILCLPNKPFPGLCVALGNGFRTATYGKKETFEVVLHDRWDNEAGLAGKTLDDIQVVIRRERPGELVRAQQRRDLLTRLWRTEDELATAERTIRLREARERNVAKHRGDLLLFKQKIKAQAASSADAQKALQGETKIELEATTKRAEVEELRALDAALTSDPDWQLDNNAEEQLKSADNVRVSVALNPLSGFTVEYTIEKPTSDDANASTGQYVIIVKLHGEHITSSPASVMCWGESLFAAPALPAFAFSPPTATGSSPYNQSGLLAGMTTTATRRKDRAPGGRKSRSSAAAAAAEESTSLSFSLLSLNGPEPTPGATLSTSPSSSSSPFSLSAAPPPPSTSSSPPASPFSFSTMPPLTPTSASSSSPASSFSFTTAATLAPGEPTAHFSFSSPSPFASSSPFAPATSTLMSSSSSSSSSSPSVFAFGSPTPSEPANLE